MWDFCRVNPLTRVFTKLLTILDRSEPRIVFIVLEMEMTGLFIVRFLSHHSCSLKPHMYGKTSYGKIYGKTMVKPWFPGWCLSHPSEK